MAESERLYLAYYGDDFTGSTDALESLARAGLRTLLFLSPPTSAQLTRHPNLQALGVAGRTRSLAPEAMATELRPAFAALRQLAPRHVHYKVCSTFDSSPTLGSIGCAIDIGSEVFGDGWIPLLVAAPALGRHCAFGHLFARMGGEGGVVHRLDRHPSMSRHPVTPADESDLRLHLARQTAKRTGLLDILAVGAPAAERRAALEQVIATGAEVVLIDALYQEQLAGIGTLIDEQAGARRTVFSVGSSGVEMALGAHWAEAGELQPVTRWEDIGPVEPLLVLSGSCSPVTAAQIAWAEAHDFSLVALDPNAPDEPGVAKRMLSLLRAGSHTVIHTSRGAAGPAVPTERLGGVLGRLARTAVEQAGLRRLLIAGGDTASYAGRALGVQALEMVAPLSRGAPLCRVVASTEPLDRLEVVFKGGQIGALDFFGSVACGCSRPA